MTVIVELLAGATGKNSEEIEALLSKDGSLLEGEPLKSAASKLLTDHIKGVKNEQHKRGFREMAAKVRTTIRKNWELSLIHI